MNYPLKKRLQLFNAVVMPSALYSSATWTMTKAREQKLRVAQRRMLRQIVHVSKRNILDPPDGDTDSEERSKEDFSTGDSETEEAALGDDDKQDGESWVQWIIRATRVGEAEMRKAKVIDWVEEQRRRKWRWAGHVARRDDGRWSNAVINWKPECGVRRVGGQHMRWANVIDKFLEVAADLSKGEWQFFAQDRDGWKQLEEDFILWKAG